VKAPRKRTAREVWEAIEEASFRDEVERIVGMSEEELKAELLKDGFDPAELAGPQTVAERASRRPDGGAERPPATVHPLRRVRMIAWLAAAAIGMMALVIAAKRNEVIALFGHEPVAPLPTQSPLPQKPPDVQLTSQERAAALRNEAYTACGHASWTLCESKLNEAQALDPAGEHEAAVRTARQMIHIARHPDAALLFPDTKEVPAASSR
jgi:hypothetical protein